MLILLIFVKTYKFVDILNQLYFNFFYISNELIVTQVGYKIIYH